MSCFSFSDSVEPDPTDLIILAELIITHIIRLLPDIVCNSIACTGPSVQPQWNSRILVLLQFLIQGAFGYHCSAAFRHPFLGILTPVFYKITLFLSVFPDLLLEMHVIYSTEKEQSERRPFFIQRRLRKNMRYKMYLQ